MKLVLALTSLLVFGAACATSTASTAESTSAASAASADGGKSADSEAQASAPKKDDLVCRMEAEIGSHLKKKVCRTRTQREREAREAQDAIRRGQTGARPSFQD
ncbi:hypothetical protein L6R52_42730 [Myxococcota bacterium]|nr:hypothetical protein [Myxococcota bacterium]